MSSKSKQSRSGNVTKGAFGGLRGKRRRAQVRYMATRQHQIPGGSIMNQPTEHVTQRVEKAEPSQN